ncbi:MAG: hypothetical protein ACI8RY_001477 [Urechidicola sp.]|jgi:hypothetical protein|tara:strand:+ start:2294 stop:2911 length:618 start_codon:yes stop_codon:yes gene_type:complete
MGDFFTDMSTLHIVFWITALIGSTIFLVLFVLSLLGADSDAEMDTDTEIGMDDGIGIQFFTFKNAMAFFTLFGWTGIACLDNGFSAGVSTTIAFMAGIAMMTLMSFLFLWISKLAESGTLRIENAVGNIGEVYLSIGANRSRIGKISIDVQGSKRELSALSDEKEDLKQGEVIRVTAVVSGEILLIERLTKKKIESNLTEDNLTK